MSRRFLASGTVLALTLTALVAVPPAAMAAPVTETFAYTGTEQTFMVPAGVTSVRVSAHGGRGAASIYGEGAPGGVAQATLSVVAGTQLAVTVAGDASGDGAGGYGGGGSSIFGGGGGGASTVRTVDLTLLVAAGGGGAGAASRCGKGPGLEGGNGGAAGSPGVDGRACPLDTVLLGGGGRGGAGSADDDAGSAGVAPGSEDEGCVSDGEPGSDGAGPLGGDGIRGGAGGGGYFGGGSGGSGAASSGKSCPSDGASHGGGGGGASFVDPAGLDPAVGVSDRTEANGLVTISYNLPDTTPPVVAVPASLTVAATGPAGATLTYTATATDDETTALIPVCDPASGTVFPVGTTTVTCRATDAAGNTGSASFTVTVTAPPVNAADLTVRVTGPGSVRTSTQVTYTVTVTNTGPAAAAATKTVLGAAGVATTSTAPVTGTGTLKIRDTTLTGALWTGATIAAGQSVTYTLTGKVTAKPGKLVGVAAGALSSTPDPALATNIAATATRVTT